MFSFLKKQPRFDTKADQIQELSGHPLASKFINGLDCDEMPEAYGEFGRTISNPIPVNGPIGEIRYLNRLRLHDNPIMYHRLTSTRYRTNLDEAVDIYELCDFSGQHWDILYLHMYHPRRSEMIPSSYTLTEYHPIFSKLGMGVNDFVKTFPYFLGQVLDQKYGEQFGISKTYGKLFQNDRQYIRPIEHFIKVLRLNNVGNFFDGLIAFVAQKYPSSYFIHLLRNSDTYANIAALKAIVAKGEEATDCIDAVVELDAKTSDEAVSELIADAINSMFPQIKGMISNLIDGLYEQPTDASEEDITKFDLAVGMLRIMGYRALPYLKPLLFDKDARIRKIAKDLITEIHNKTIYGL